MQGSRFIQSVVSLVLLLASLVLINVLSSFYYGSIDLTEDKRFTLNPATYKLVEKLEDVLTVEVLLEGEFPSSFKRLQNATQDLLSELRSHNSNVQVRWVNPMSGTKEENIENGERLSKDGIFPINLTQSVRGGNSRKAMLAFPYAILRYQQQMRVVPLLETTGKYNKDYTRMEAINPSINLLEYKIANAILKLAFQERPRMVLTTGHGELQRPFTDGLESAMFEYYDIDRINLDSVIHIDTLIDVLVVPKPTRPFPEKHLFMIDQYVMRGGKILWLVDALNMEEDSLKRLGMVMPSAHKLNISNLLFNYGVRINPNLVLDWESSVIPVNVSPTPNRPQIEGRKWFYHPKVHSYMTPLDAQETGENTIQHPIVQNLDFVDTRYPASIDTIKTSTYIKKTPLLRSSPYSKVQFPPVRVSLQIMQKGLRQADFNKGNQNIAVLLEGSFSSYYKNRVTPEMEQGLKQLGQPFVDKGVPTKMIVVSDGDIAKNALDMDKRPLSSLPLGLNPYDKYLYANKDFLMNCMEYLIGNRGIIAARNKQIKLRPLDQERAYNEEIKWQLINLILPLVVLMLFGFCYTLIRRQRFAK